MITLFDLPHADAKAIVSKGAPVYLGVNPVEYHGPHLSLHNDRLVSRGLAERMHGLLSMSEWPMIWAEDIEMGVEPVPGPGTRAASFPMLRSALLDACHGLAELGAQRVIICTFHGSPLHNLAIEEALESLRARGIKAIAPLHILLEALIEPPPGLLERFAPAVAQVSDPALRKSLLDDLPLDFHAGFFETSVALALAPASVSPLYRDLPPCPPVVPKAGALASARALKMAGRYRLAKELEFIAAGLGWYAVRPFPGYTSRPSLASAEAGQVFVDAIVRMYAEAARAVLIDGAPAPKPPMPWIRWATLGGRVKAGLEVE